MQSKKRTKKYSSRLKDPTRPKGKHDALGYVLVGLRTEETANKSKFDRWMRNLTVSVTMFAKGEAIPTAFEHLTYACLRMIWLNKNIGLPFEGGPVLQEATSAVNATHRRLIKWEKLEMTADECAKVNALVKYMKNYYGQFLVVDIDQATKYANAQLKICAKAVIEKTQDYIKE